MSKILDVAVIGAGQAGLATAHALLQSGLDYCVIEATSRAAGSWPSYYDSLTLFSPARYSSLPGLPFPGDPEHYPAREEVISYLETYANHFAFPIRYDSRVTRVEREGEHFLLHIAGQNAIRARTVVVASGPFNQPHIPSFNGLTDFKGQVLHSSAYRRPADITGQRVAVVGAGNSAVQIAYELSQTHPVILTSREPPRLMAQRPLGRDIHFWLTNSGLDTLPLGAWFHWQTTTPVLDTGINRKAIETGQIQVKPIFERITGHGLQWGDRTEPVDTLLLATGFSNQPVYLDGLDGYDAATVSEQRDGVAVHNPGLYFIGVSWQRSNASATLRGVGHDAQRVAAHLGRYLQSGPVRSSCQPWCCA